MPHILLAALGGAVGSSFRYLVGVWALRFFGPGYPWGTFIVNVVGSFLIGVLAEFIALKMNASSELRVLIVTGFLGGFTTFSAFSLETMTLFERGALGLSAIYVLSSLVLSIAAVFAGLALVRSLV
ncbi:fluoride efflux transporter CrcB [Rhizobium sp. L1K21]|uniref:fluoride efflux transporter CrcB n=1 Tax=Rhizobium sp. L1K21 TaxID=2954933 RepID=UPI002091E907|nr:fluoride efflux transporter CrcB [Rhizobium sp. L1K21]MCO6186169.1 fluoride efflux transporter CrcB [Rhizobium sp. L1K21]